MTAMTPLLDRLGRIADAGVRQRNELLTGLAGMLLDLRAQGMSIADAFENQRRTRSKCAAQLRQMLDTAHERMTDALRASGLLPPSNGAAEAHGVPSSEAISKDTSTNA